MSNFQGIMRGVVTLVATLAGNGNVIIALPGDMSPSDEFDVQYQGVGAAPAAITVNVFGSLDGINFSATPMMTSANTNDVLSIKAKFPFVQIQITGLTLAPATGIAILVRPR